MLAFAAATTLYWAIRLPIIWVNDHRAHRRRGAGFKLVHGAGSRVGRGRSVLRAGLDPGASGRARSGGARSPWASRRGARRVPSLAPAPRRGDRRPHRRAGPAASRHPAGASARPHHLARNADSVVRRLEAAARRVVDQYVGGREGRAADIEAGAARPAVELLADVRTSSARCDEACAGVPAEVWERPTRGLGGDVSPAAFLAFSRWREVEVHHVDLGLGYEPSSWPAELVERWLPHELGRLPGRTEPAALLAWALGRAEAPPLGDW
ncbi:MAG: maleylpyruvate isomerase N-terminal domain-containing protein [Acidimicrobiales bacterium]